MDLKKEVESSNFYLSLNIFFIILPIILISGSVYAEQFNMEVKIPETYKTVSPGSEIWFTVNAINLGSTNRIDVVLNSAIVDKDGAVKASTTKTVAMETTAAFVNSIRLPDNLQAGEYYVVASIDLLNRTVESRAQFAVRTSDDRLFWIAGIIAGSLIIIFVIFLMIKSNKSSIEKMTLRMRIKEIIKKRLKK